MKRVSCAFVASYYGPYYSNYVASVLALETAMQESGFHSVYIFPEEVRNFEWIHRLEKLTQNIYYVPYNPQGIDNLVQLRNIFKKEKINLIYSRMGGWDFLAHFACPTLPIIWHMDMNVNVADRKKKIKNWIKFHILGFGKTYHVAVSYVVRDEINSLHPRNRCIGIPNALDFSRLSFHADRETPVPRPAKVLLFGWDPVIKGLDIALDAMENANRDGIRYELLVSVQDQTTHYLEKRYQQVPEWLKLLPPTDTVAGLSDQADIMLSASRSESFSYCVAEAIYSGLPVVISDIPGTSWANEFAGVRSFASGSSTELQRALECCTSEPMTSAQRQNNRDLMMKKYSMDAWTCQIMSFIKKVMKI